MKIDDQFILDIKRMGINGEGIGFYNKLAIFVDGAIPGEGHDICITKVDGKMAFGKTVEIKVRLWIKSLTFLFKLDALFIFSFDLFFILASSYMKV